MDFLCNDHDLMYQRHGQSKEYIGIDLDLNQWMLSD